MQFTKNIKLTQFEANDVTSWLQDYNGDMRRIDTFAGEMLNTTSITSGYLDVVEGRVKELEDTSTEHSTQIAVNTSSISMNMQRIANIENAQSTEYNALNSEIENLKEVDDSQNERLTVAEANLRVVRSMAAVNASSISKNQLNIETLTDRVDELDSTLPGEVDALKTVQQEHTNTLALMDAEITNVKTTAENAKESADNTAVALDTLSENVDVNKADIDALKETDSNLSEEIAEVRASIDVVSVTVSAHTQSIENINTEITTLDQRVESLEDNGNAEALTQRVDALETGQTELGTELTATKQTATEANTTANNVSAQVKNIQSGVSVPFSFGTDSSGNYGYYKAGADTVTPFLTPWDTSSGYDTLILSDESVITLTPSSITAQGDWTIMLVFLNGVPYNLSSYEVEYGYNDSGTWRRRTHMIGGDIEPDDIPGYNANILKDIARFFIKTVPGSKIYAVEVTNAETVPYILFDNYITTLPLMFICNTTNNRLIAPN